MEATHYLLIALTVVILLGIIAVIVLLRRKTGSSAASQLQKAPQNIEEHPIALSDPDELTIAFESIKELSAAEERALTEIKDEKLIAKIKSTLPDAFQAVGQANEARLYRQAAKEVGKLYEAILPPGEQLVRSRGMEGAYRGFSRGADHINAQANLKPYDPKNLEKLAQINAVNAVMDTAAMVVGQYYMAQIDHQLEDISDKMEQIADFQENEYKSKVYALIAEVQKCSKFQFEIMDSEELRNRQLDHLRFLEHECAQLLGQANLTIEDIEQKPNADYASYEKNVKAAHTWYLYQQLLLKILTEIAELTYVLSLGTASKEQCYSLTETYTKQSEDVLQSLEAWHEKNVKAFEINLDADKRKKQGWDRFLATVPALFDHSLQYKRLPVGLADTIKQHRGSADLNNREDQNDLFHQNVRLIMKDDKIYYLPESVQAEDNEE